MLLFRTFCSFSKWNWNYQPVKSVLQIRSSNCPTGWRHIILLLYSKVTTSVMWRQTSLVWIRPIYKIIIALGVNISNIKLFRSLLPNVSKFWWLENATRVRAPIFLAPLGVMYETSVHTCEAEHGPTTAGWWFSDVQRLKAGATLVYCPWYCNHIVSLIWSSLRIIFHVYFPPIGLHPIG